MFLVLPVTLFLLYFNDILMYKRAYLLAGLATLLIYVHLYSFVFISFFHFFIADAVAARYYLLFLLETTLLSNR